MRLLGLLALAATAAVPPQLAPGVGVLCTMMLIDVSAEAGRRCHAGQSPEIQSMLERAEKKLDRFFLKNGPATTEQLAQFKRRHAGIGAPDFKCAAADEIYTVMNKKNPVVIDQEIDKLVARPGKPTFGDCL